MLSPVLGSDDVVAVASLDLAVLATVVLVTVVVVLVVVAAGFTAESVVGSAPGCPAAGPAPPSGSPVPPPGTSRLSVSPTGGVATLGSTTTCGATAPDVFRQEDLSKKSIGN